MSGSLSNEERDGNEKIKKTVGLISKTKSAYHMYGNFGENFPPNGTSIFWATKTGMGLSCTIYKIPVNFSLSLDNEAWHWLSKQMVQEMSVVSVRTGKR